MNTPVDAEKITYLKNLLREAKSSIQELQKYQRPDSVDASLASKEANKVLYKINSELGEGLKSDNLGAGFVLGVIFTAVVIFLYFKFFA